jgi:hypothetical protein
MVPVTIDLRQEASLADAHLFTTAEPSLVAANRTERVCFDSRPPMDDLPRSAEGVPEPVVKSAPPFSVPVEWPPHPADEFRVAALSSVEPRISPPSVLTRDSRDPRRKRVVGLSAGPGAQRVHRLRLRESDRITDNS